MRSARVFTATIAGEGVEPGSGVTAAASIETTGVSTGVTGTAATVSAGVGAGSVSTFSGFSLASIGFFFAAAISAATFREVRRFVARRNRTRAAVVVAAATFTGALGAGFAAVLLREEREAEAVRGVDFEDFFFADATFVAEDLLRERRAERDSEASLSGTAALLLWLSPGPCRRRAVSTRMVAAVRVLERGGFG
jgi:hypothetical protein